MSASILTRFARCPRHGWQVQYVVFFPAFDAALIIFRIFYGLLYTHPRQAFAAAKQVVETGAYPFLSCVYLPSQNWTQYIGRARDHTHHPWV